MGPAALKNPTPSSRARGARQPLGKKTENDYCESCQKQAGWRSERAGEWAQGRFSNRGNREILCNKMITHFEVNPMRRLRVPVCPAGSANADDKTARCAESP